LFAKLRSLAPLLKCRVVPPGLRAVTRFSSASIGARDDLEHVPIGIFEIYAAAAVVMVDLVRPRFPRVCPVGYPLIANSGECCVKFALLDQKCIVLHRDRCGLFQADSSDERNTI
jgi:hypothetical protein